MSGTSRLLDLAKALYEQIAHLQIHLDKTEQANPSFDGNAKFTDWNGVEDIRSSAIEKLLELQDSLSTPRELLQSRTPTNLISRHALDRFNIPSLVPINGSITYTELSQATSISENTLRRVIRHAIAHRILAESSPGAVSHTQASRLLAENSAVRDYYGTVCQEVWPAATRVCDAMERWPHSRDRSESGYQLAFGRTILDTLAADPAKQGRYDNTMGANTSGSSSIEQIVNYCGFDAIRPTGTVVDVGGGVGTMSKAFAKAFPQLNFIVEDRPEVLLKTSVEEEESSIRARIQFLEHDFFTTQPVKSADVYFFRRVFMEWPDEKAVQILAALKPALKDGALVQIQDPMLPEPGTCPLWQERKFRNSDLLGFAIGGGRGQRDVKEWRGVFDKAGPGFEFRGVRMVPESDVAFIEAIWRGEGISHS